MQGITMSSEVAEKVIAIIAETKAIPPADISLDSSFRDLGIDSLTALGIVFDIEDEFDISIPNEEALTMTNVREAVESLQRVLAGG